MGKKKRRVGQRLVAPPMKSLRKARRVTTEFHAHTSASRCEVQTEAPHGGESGRLHAPEELHKSYQEASVLTTSQHSTSKWVKSTLLEMGLRRPSASPPPRLLEIGAINLQLKHTTWLDTTAIDLRSTHPLIAQQDFLTLPVPTHRPFDVVVCAMVLNCVPSAPLRGRMLERAFDMLCPQGLLFVVLPSNCFTLSRFNSLAVFERVLMYAGFWPVLRRRTTPKLEFFCCQRMPNQRREQVRREGGWQDAHTKAWRERDGNNPQERGKGGDEAPVARLWEGVVGQPVVLQQGNRRRRGDFAVTFEERE